MKRITLSLLCAVCLMLSLTAYAQSGTAFNARLFTDAKKALMLLEAQDYEAAAAVLKTFEPEELRNFATEKFSTFGKGVQSKVSVAYWMDDAWHLAVPLYEPENDHVEALVLLIKDDLSGFSKYRRGDWGGVKDRYSQCDYVIWNEEYVPNSPYIIED